MPMPVKCPQQEEAVTWVCRSEVHLQHPEEVRYGPPDGAQLGHTRFPSGKVNAWPAAWSSPRPP